MDALSWARKSFERDGVTFWVARMGEVGDPMSCCNVGWDCDGLDWWFDALEKVELCGVLKSPALIWSLWTPTWPPLCLPPRPPLNVERRFLGSVIFPSGSVWWMNPFMSVILRVLLILSLTFQCKMSPYLEDIISFVGHELMFTFTSRACSVKKWKKV
jgi:hypothetical protein